MSPRSAFMQLITKAAICFGALFLVGVVLAAIPNHRPPVMAGTSLESYGIAQQEQQQNCTWPLGWWESPGLQLRTNRPSEPYSVRALGAKDRP